jgi:hypothetical protein
MLIAPIYFHLLREIHALNILLIFRELIAALKFFLDFTEMFSP